METAGRRIRNPGLDLDPRSDATISVRRQLSKRYHIREFAELAGVTVKALHHYDRLGLLKPGRTDAGYRVYTERDMERLEQIVALKFLGFPLKQLQHVLDRSALDWPNALRVQRRAIEDQHARLGRAVRAIRAAEAAIAQALVCHRWHYHEGRERRTFLQPEPQAGPAATAEGR
jgi:DNA-binding transcriptional MerR regulator